ncbi:MAG: hypothetical protein M3Y72_20485 [Acidobacteriota bacterium]|nr:hypothetical protein [Acidobacteriota bacterium]
MLDKDQIVAEIAKRNGIRIEDGDPIFAVVTATQVGLEESVRELQNEFRTMIAEFEANVQTVERHAGTVLAKEVKRCAGEVRTELRKDIDSAGLKARELVQRVHEAHQRPNIIIWASIGLLCAIALFCSGIWFGRLTAGQ